MQKGKSSNKEPSRDPVQTQINIVQQAIVVYSIYLAHGDGKFSPDVRASLVKKIEHETKNLDRLKSKHPEYFI